MLRRKQKDHGNSLDCVQWLQNDKGANRVHKKAHYGMLAFPLLTILSSIFLMTCGIDDPHSSFATTVTPSMTATRQTTLTTTSTALTSTPTVIGDKHLSDNKHPSTPSVPPTQTATSAPTHTTTTGDGKTSSNSNDKSSNNGNTNSSNNNKNSSNNSDNNSSNNNDNNSSDGISDYDRTAFSISQAPTDHDFYQKKEQVLLPTTAQYSPVAIYATLSNSSTKPLPWSATRSFTPTTSKQWLKYIGPDQKETYSGFVPAASCNKDCLNDSTGQILIDYAGLALGRYSATIGFGIRNTPPDPNYTYTFTLDIVTAPDLKPIITNIRSAGGYRIIITGSNFKNDATAVMFDSQQGFIVSFPPSDTEILADPPSTITPLGPIHITVTTPYGTSNSATFTYQAPGITPTRTPIPSPITPTIAPTATPTPTKMPTKTPPTPTIAPTATPTHKIVTPTSVQTTPTASPHTST